MASLSSERTRTTSSRYLRGPILSACWVCEGSQPARRSEVAVSTSVGSTAYSSSCEPADACPAGACPPLRWRRDDPRGAFQDLSGEAIASPHRRSPPAHPTLY